jgi:enoyl-CoA hydratase/carnithine racemase
MGATYFLPRLIGLSRASEYLYTGDTIDAITAERIGLVSQVVADDQLDEVAQEMARKMLNTTPFALRMTKELLNVNIDAPSLMAATQVEGRSQCLCGFTEDIQEAMTASLVEKRPPVYRDR